MRRLGLGLLILLALTLDARACGGGTPTTTCKANLRNLGTALEMYSTDIQGRYPQTLAQVAPDYLKALPTCPSSGLTYRYARAEQPDARTLVKHRAHPGAGPGGR